MQAIPDWYHARIYEIIFWNNLNEEGAYYIEKNDFVCRRQEPIFINITKVVTFYRKNFQI